MPGGESRKGRRMFFEVNGIELYYEKAGQGAPVILLHGNGEDNTIFDVLIKQLSQKYTVYAIDSRDHGKSGRVKTLDYETMMEDIAEFIRAQEIRRPMLYGFSDGGIIGLLMAIRYPGLLSKLIISGANTHPSGIKNTILTIFKVMHLFSGNQKHKLMLTQPDITDAELNMIAVPTLVLAGSRDAVSEEHTRKIAENIPGSVLRILEGETHTSYVIHSEKLYGIIEPFLAS